MATTITTHCKMGIVDSAGNVNVLYPQTTGADVSITPNSVVSATTLQGLVDALKGSAFISNFTGIDDSSTSSTTATLSAAKITELNSDLNDRIGTTVVKTLAANATTVEFDVPTSGNNNIEFFISDGASYTYLNTGVSGKVEVTYESSTVARTVSCHISPIPEV